ncbi:MAG: transglycosylase SLT domain-containing protein [Chloroflexota bacterium]
MSVKTMTNRMMTGILSRLSLRARLIIVLLTLGLLGIAGYHTERVLNVQYYLRLARARIADIRYAPAPPPQADHIAPLFSPEVIYWEDDIVRWSQQYNLDPNLLATVMQIESCGHPTVNSPAGAQGLFQVMPFHFADGENMLDPDTNAMRGARFLNECIGWASGDIGLAMACYNGGPGVIQRNPANWYSEVKRYYAWGVPIYADALVHKTESETLTRWMNAGGARLCNSASSQLGLR